MELPEYISSMAIFVAIVILISQTLQSNKLARLQNFTNYTQRYQDIFLNLSMEIESRKYDLENLKQEDKEKTLRWIRAYFDLCSEEFYLNQNGYLDKTVWELWEGGMRDSLQKPAFKQSWDIIQKEQYYAKEFSEFICHMNKY